MYLDLDECKLDTHNCHSDGVCTNTKGSFVCSCKTGFKGTGVQCQGMYFKLSISVKKISRASALFNQYFNQKC